jgi:hypothetical protein
VEVNTLTTHQVGNFSLKACAVLIYVMELIAVIYQVFKAYAAMQKSVFFYPATPFFSDEWHVIPCFDMIPIT